MFFIGGFNSVLPHLLYISLIWAFLIIGFSGKLNMLRSGKPIHKENSNIYISNKSTIHNSVKILDSKDRETGEVPFHFRYLRPARTITPVEIARVVTSIHRQIHSIKFRGPPLMA